MMEQKGSPVESRLKPSSEKDHRYTELNGWREGCRLVELGVLLYNLRWCKACGHSPVPLTYSSVKGEEKKGLSGYLLVLCPNPACKATNRVGYGKIVGRVNSQGVGVTCFDVNANVTAEKIKSLGGLSHVNEVLAALNLDPIGSLGYLSDLAGETTGNFRGDDCDASTVEIETINVAQETVHSEEEDFDDVEEEGESFTPEENPDAEPTHEALIAVDSVEDFIASLTGQSGDSQKFTTTRLSDDTTVIEVENVDDVMANIRAKKCHSKQLTSAVATTASNSSLSEGTTIVTLDNVDDLTASRGAERGDSQQFNHSTATDHDHRKSTDKTSKPNDRQPDMTSPDLDSTASRPYACHICQKTFGFKSGLYRHIKLHTDPKVYKCDFCDEEVCGKDNFKVHKAGHTGARLYRCKKCNKSYSSYPNLKRHRLMHLGIKPFKCTLCDKKFKELAALNNHLNVHRAEKIKPFKCDICNMAFTQKVHVKRHILSKHTNQYKCGYCEESFQRKGQRGRHIQQCHKPHQCDQCPKAFLKKCHLERHIASHTGIKEFICDICATLFSTKGTLNRHFKRLHSDIAVEKKLKKHH